MNTRSSIHGMIALARSNNERARSHSTVAADHMSNATSANSWVATNHEAHGVPANRVLPPASITVRARLLSGNYKMQQFSGHDYTSRTCIMIANSSQYLLSFQRCASAQSHTSPHTCEVFRLPPPPKRLSERLRWTWTVLSS